MFKWRPSLLSSELKHADTVRVFRRKPNTLRILTLSLAEFMGKLDNKSRESESKLQVDSFQSKISGDTMRKERPSVFGYYLGDCIGEGSFSCVFRAFRTKDGDDEHPNFAVKAVRPEYSILASREAIVLSSINRIMHKKGLSNESGIGIVHLYDSFLWREHACLVLQHYNSDLAKAFIGTPLLSFSSSQSRKRPVTPIRTKKHYRRNISLAIAAIKSICKTILPVLECLHEQPQNIFCDLIQFNNSKVTRSNPDLGSHSNYNNIVLPPYEWVESLLNHRLPPKVALGDFGSVISRTTDLAANLHPSANIQTTGYQSPELIFDCVSPMLISDKIDVFAFGITILELAIGKPLIAVKQKDEDRNVKVLAQLTAVLGKIPLTIFSSSLLLISISSRSDRKSIFKHADDGIGLVSRRIVCRREMARKLFDFISDQLSNNNNDDDGDDSSGLGDEYDCANDLWYDDGRDDAKRIAPIATTMMKDGLNYELNDFCGFLSLLLQFDPDDRLSASEACHHPFLLNATHPIDDDDETVGSSRVETTMIDGGKDGIEIDKEGEVVQVIERPVIKVSVAKSSLELGFMKDDEEDEIDHKHEGKVRRVEMYDSLLFAMN